MDITHVYNAMSRFTEMIGNILIVGSMIGLVVLGRAIFKAYMPEEANHEP